MQFNPWSFGNPSAVPPFGQGFPPDMQQLMQLWQQFQAMYANNPLFGNKTAPFFHQPFQQPWGEATSDTQLATAAAKLISALSEARMGLDKEKVADAARAYAHVLLAARDVTGPANNEVMRSYFQQAITTLRWLAEQNRVTMPSLLSGHIEKGNNSIALWIDCLEALVAFLYAYSTFTNTTGADFGDMLLQKLETDYARLLDETALQNLFVAHYEKAFAGWLQSPNYRELYGRLVNSMSAVQKDQQTYIDAYVESFGLPSKQEMDTTHQRAHKQSREIRSLSDSLHTFQQQLQDVVRTSELEKIHKQLHEYTSELAEIKQRAQQQQTLFEQQQQTLAQIQQETQQLLSLVNTLKSPPAKKKTPSETKKKKADNNSQEN